MLALLLSPFGNMIQSFLSVSALESVDFEAVHKSELVSTSLFLEGFIRTLKGSNTTTTRKCMTNQAKIVKPFLSSSSKKMSYFLFFL